MKKCMTVIWMLTCTLALAGCNHRSMDYIIANEPGIIGTVQAVRDNTMIIYAETDCYLNGAVYPVSLDAENADNYTDLSEGYGVIAYYGGYISESSPLRINTVYAVPAIFGGYYGCNMDIFFC